MQLVSIHAPVMDANYLPLFVKQRGGFNPRARDGRELLTGIIATLIEFQSTRP